MDRFIRKAGIGLVIGLFVLVSLSVFTALTASNTVPFTRADKQSMGVSANELKPSECDGITLTNIVDVGAGESGTPANDLILGTDKKDEEIRGGDGDDCILGGKGKTAHRPLQFAQEKRRGEDQVFPGHAIDTGPGGIRGDELVSRGGPCLRAE